MMRRIALGALAAPILLRGAAAQDSRENRAGQGITSTQAPPANDAQAAMLGAMAFAMATAQLAERAAENPAAKAFGALEVEEQTAFSTARQMAGLRVPTVELMPEQQRQLMIQMREMRGAEFDRTFIREQLTGHEQLLRLHEQAVRNPTSRAEEMLATVAIPAIRSHLVMLQGIGQSMRG